MNGWSEPYRNGYNDAKRETADDVIQVAEQIKEQKNMIEKMEETDAKE